MHPLIHRLMLLTQWRIIGWLFALLLLFNLAIFPALVHHMQQVNPEVLPPLDIRLSWTANEGRAWAAHLGAARSWALFTSWVVDMVYPVVYGLLLVFLLLRYLPWAISQKAHTHYYYLAFVPILAVWVDWLENLCIGTMAWCYPDYPEWVGHAAAIFTTLKWWSVALSLLLLMAVVAIALWRQMRSKASA